MDKTYTDVFVLGKSYSLGGFEDKEYLERVAARVNTTAQELRKTTGFVRQTAEHQNILLMLTLAYELCKEQDGSEQLKKRLEALETENYNLKHELVTNRLQHYEDDER